MKAEIEKEYREKLRDFMSRRGRKIEWDERNQELYPEWPEGHVCKYGWTDYEAQWHIVGGMDRKGPECQWVVPEGAELVEQTYSQFAGTFTENNQEVGINVGPCHCACGKYTDVTLRYKGSLTEVLHDLLGLSTQTRFTL